MMKQQLRHKETFGEQDWVACVSASSGGGQRPSIHTDEFLSSKDCVVEYLNTHVAHSQVGVQRIVDMVAADEVVKKEEFLLALYFLRLAVKRAQESVFDVQSSDEEEGDSLACVQKKISYGEDEEEEDCGWKIDTSLQENEQKIHNLSEQTKLCLHVRPVDEEEACGPLGQGLLSMTGRETMVHKTDPWSVFDADPALSIKSSNTRANTCDANEIPASARSVSLVTAYKKLIGPIPGTSILPLTEAEKKISMDSFVEKGYEHSGGMPIRDAIDMYHKLNTGHVHFSRVWALVDPHTVCKIDKRYFCAFIALVQNIVQQGDAVRLPKHLTDEDVCRLTLEMVEVQKANENSMHLDLKTLTRHDETLWDMNSDIVNTPRTFVDTECSNSDLESDDGLSVVSRMPSIARSLGSMSFRGMKNFILRNNSKIRYENQLSAMRTQSYASHKLDSAAWKDMAGQENNSLEITFLYAALGTRKKFGDVFAEFELRDATNRLLTLPVETTPGVLNRNKGTVKFDRHPRKLETMLKDIPPETTLFFSLKQWKESKKKMSTIAWSYVDCDMVCDFGSICRVREGNVALPLFKKPMDLSKRLTKRLNTNHPCLYISISGK